MIEVNTPELDNDPQLGWLGRTVDWCAMQLSPAWGSRRIAARNLWKVGKRRIRKLRSWSYIENDRVQGERWLTSNLSPNSELENEIEDHRNRAISLYKNESIAHAAVEGRVTYEVGAGLTPQGRVQPEELGLSRKVTGLINKRLEGVYRSWSESGVDRTGREDMPSVQRLITRTFAMQGEAFIRIGTRRARRPGLIPLRLDLIDPSRVSTPPSQYGNERIRLGIETDAEGEVVAYHVQKSHPGDGKEYTYQWERVPAYDDRGMPLMLHVFEPLFPAQLRGLPWLAAAAQRIKDIDDYWEAELVSKQIEACFSAFIKEPEGIDPLQVATSQSSENDSDGNRLEDIRPGQIHYLNDGEEITFADPSRPGAGFAPFIEQSLRSIAAAANYPYELLSKNFFRTTFSSGRLAMLDGRIGFKMRQSVLVAKSLKAIWQWVVFWSVMMELVPYLRRKTYIEMPQLYERHAWQARESIAFIDPEKEINAHTKGIESGMESMTEVLAERGVDYDEHMDTRKREKFAEAEMEAEVMEKRKELGLDEQDDEEEPANGSQNRKPEPAGAGA